ncbi:TAF3 family protein [Megaselia abdita]
MDNYFKQMLKVVVAQICQKVGWQSIKEFPLELLSDVLDRFLQEFTKGLSKYVELCGRIEPNLEDVALVVDQMKINLHELFEFIKNVDPVSFVIETPKLPFEKPNSLNMLRSGDSELIQRPSQFQEQFPSINIVSDGVDKVKTESQDIENIEENKNQNVNSSFKMPTFLPKDESLTQRNEEDECKGVSYGNSSVQMDKFGVIKVSGTKMGKIACSKPPFFNVPQLKPVKIETTSMMDSIKTTPTPAVIEKKMAIEKPKALLPAKITDLPIECPQVTPNQNDISVIKKEKKERKKKKLLQIQEKQQKKQLKNMHKALAFQKGALIDKPIKSFDKSHQPVLNLPSTSVIIEEPHTRDLAPKIDFSELSSKIVPDNPMIENKLIAIDPVKTDTPQKIPSEHDKNKLNIFKKISVKKDVHHAISVVDDKSPIDNFNLPFGTTITPAPPMEMAPILTQKDSVRHKESTLNKTKESSLGKTKDHGKSKDIQALSNTDSSKKDDLMSSFAARAMMSIIGSTKCHEEPNVKIKKRKFKPDRIIEDTKRLFNEPLNLTSSVPTSTLPVSLKTPQDSNVIDLSMEPIAAKSEKSSLVNFHQSSSQELTAINKKLMKMDTVMKPTFTNPIVTPMQHHIFNLPGMGTDLPPAFQNMHVPMFGFSVPPPVLPPPPIITESSVGSSSNYLIQKSQPIILNEPIEVSSDESTKGGEDMEIEPPTIRETPPKEISPEKSLLESPCSPDKKKKGHKKHKKNKKGNEEKLEKNKKRKRKNKDIYEEQLESQKDKKKKDKKKDKKDKKVKSEEDISFTSTNEEIKSELIQQQPNQIPLNELLNPIETDIAIPKLTLKIGSNSVSPEKNIVDEEPVEALQMVETARIEGNSSPELAKISALITHAPKQKHFENSNKSPQIPPILTQNITNIPFPESFKSPLKISTSSSNSNEVGSLFLSPKIEKLIPLPTVSSNIPKLTVASCSATSSAPTSIESNRPSSYIDEEGNEVWICPACGRVDDGTPMIGCDGCDAWYHWICVGIKEPPNKSDDWFCRVCILKNREEQFNFPPGERKKKSKKSKKSNKNID